MTSAVRLKAYLFLFSAPSAPVLTAHPVHPGAPQTQGIYQQQPPPVPMHPLYAQYQPYQPPLQPVMPPPPDPVQPLQPVQPEAAEEEEKAPAQPEVPSPAVEAEPADAPVQGEKDMSIYFLSSFEMVVSCSCFLVLSCFQGIHLKIFKYTDFFLLTFHRFWEENHKTLIK